MFSQKKKEKKATFRRNLGMGGWRGKVQVFNTRLIIHYMTLPYPVSLSLSLPPSLPPLSHLPSSLFLPPSPPSLPHSISPPITPSPSLSLSLTSVAGCRDASCEEGVSCVLSYYLYCVFATCFATCCNAICGICLLWVMCNLPLVSFHGQDNNAVLTLL